MGGFPPLSACPGPVTTRKERLVALKFTSWPLAWDSAQQLGQANQSAGLQAHQLTLESEARTAKCTLSCPLHLKAHDHLSQPPGKYGYEQVYNLLLITLDNLWVTSCGYQDLTAFLTVQLAAN